MPRSAIRSRCNLWKRTHGSRFALLPNLNVADPVWRKLLQDVRFRRALSLAIDRDEINKAVFFGLANDSADTVLPESPLYRPEYAQAWIAASIPRRPTRCSTRSGLDKRDDDGIRLLPDGRPAQIIIETAGESMQETDVLELVTDHWRKVGIALFIRTSQRDVFRSRCMNGEIMMSMWSGIDNGVPTADMNPGQLAPTTDDQLQWPLWGSHYLSHGKRGEAPDLPAAAELVALVERWRRSAEMAERAAIWAEMLTLYTDQVFSIGIVNRRRSRCCTRRGCATFPRKGSTASIRPRYFGVYMPDTFWLADEA